MSFHGDESDWLTMGVRAINLVFAGRLADPVWLENGLEHGAFDLAQAPVTKYLLGVTLRLFGIQSGDWIYWYSGRYDIPPDYVLVPGRAVIALTGYLTLFVIYFLGRELKDHKAGLVAVLLLGFHPLWLICSRRAMSDTPAILFSTLAVLFLLRGLKRKSSGSVLPFLLSGVALGLAIDTKYNAIFLGFVLLSYMCARIAICQHVGDSTALSSIRKVALFVLASVATTVLINPVLYPNPFTQFLKIVSIWQSSSFFSSSIEASGSLVMLAGSFHILIFPGVSIVSVLWPSYPWSWDSPGTLTTATASLFFMIGIVIIGIRTIRDARRMAMGAPALILLWFFGEVLFTSVTVRIMFERYFLPILPPMVLIAALGLASLLDSARVRVRTCYQAARKLSVVLFLVSSVVTLLAFYPELYERAWSYPGNIPQFCTIQQAIARPVGQVAILLFVFAVACTILVLRLPLEVASTTHTARENAT